VVVRADYEAELVTDWVSGCAADWAVRSSQSMTHGLITRCHVAPRIRPIRVGSKFVWPFGGSTS
jgi:hypothetical protein